MISISAGLGIVASIIVLYAVIHAATKRENGK